MSARPEPTIDSEPHVHSEACDYEEYDEETVARIDENLALMVRFVEMLGDDPSIADDIPAYASVIFLPHDDADLAARNRAAGERMRAAGATVHFIDV